MDNNQTGKQRASLYTDGLRDLPWRGGAVFMLFALITVLFFWPVLSQLTTALIGPAEDNLNDFWNSWYVTSLPGKDSFFYTRMVRFPEGANLYFHDFAYVQTSVLWLITRITGTAQSTRILLQNISLLLTFPLAGVTAYYFVRHVIREAPLREGAALAGGFVYAFNPSHMAQVLHHIGVAQIEFFPLFALCWILTIERRSGLWLLAAIGSYVLGALSCWYYLFYTAFFLLFHTIYRMWRDNKLPDGWTLKALAACFLTTALLLTPLLIPMMMAGSGSRIYYDGNNFFVADLAGFLLFPSTHLLASVSRTLVSQLAGNSWESAVYLGLANLILLCGLLLHRQDRNNPTLHYALCGMIVFAILAMGNSPHIIGYDIPGIHLPNLLLSKLPFIGSMRTPSRIIVLVYLFLALAVGYGVSRLAHSHHRAARPALILFLLLCIADFYPAGISMTDATCPQAIRAITEDKEPGIAVLDLPIGNISANTAMFRQTCHGKPILTANLSRILSPSLINRLPMSDTDRQRDVLRQSRVKYIILRNDMPWSDTSGYKADYADTYPIIAHTPELTVLQVYGAIDSRAMQH